MTEKNEMGDTLIEIEEYGNLSTYPYKDCHGQYVLHRKLQRKAFYSTYFNPCCTNASRHEIIFRIMYWVGLMFAIAAILVSLCKHWYGHNKEEEFILNLTVLEMVLAIISIWIALLKHALHYNELIRLEENILIDNRRRKRMIGRKVFFILGAILTILISGLLIGFPVLNQTSTTTLTQFMEYTKFSTTLTLFIALIIDNILAEILSDIYNVVQLDQCKLVIHQLKEELKEHVEKERIEILEDYLEKNKAFSLSDTPHIKYEGLITGAEYEQIPPVDGTTNNTSAVPTTTISNAGEDIVDISDGDDPHV